MTQHREAVALMLAAKRTLSFVVAFTSVPHSEGTGEQHAKWMLEKVAAGEFDNMKSATRLGYAQALCVVQGRTTLDAVRDINRKAKVDAGLPVDN